MPDTRVNLGRGQARVRPDLIFAITEHEAAIAFGSYVSNAFCVTNEVTRGSSIPPRISERAPVPHFDIVVVGP